jgi:hypothetical protein
MQGQQEPVLRFRQHIGPNTVNDCAAMMWQGNIMRCSWLHATRRFIMQTLARIRRVFASWQKEGAPDVLGAVGVIKLQLRGVRAVHKILAMVWPVGRQALVGVRHLLHMHKKVSA